MNDWEAWAWYPSEATAQNLMRDIAGRDNGLEVRIRAVNCDVYAGWIIETRSKI